MPPKKQLNLRKRLTLIQKQAAVKTANVNAVETRLFDNRSLYLAATAGPVKPNFFMFNNATDNDDVNEETAKIVALNNAVEAILKRHPIKPAPKRSDKQLLTEIDYRITSVNDLYEAAKEIAARIIAGGVGVRLFVDVGFLVRHPYIAKKDKDSISLDQVGKQVFYPSANSSLFGSKTSPILHTKTDIENACRLLYSKTLSGEFIDKIKTNMSGAVAIGIYQLKVKIFDTALKIGNGDLEIPEWLLKSKNYFALKDAPNNTCGWAAIALFKNPTLDPRKCIKPVKELMNKFYGKMTKQQFASYGGINYPTELPAIETFLNIGINVWVVTANEQSGLTLQTHADTDRFTTVIDLIMIGDKHFCLMKPEGKKHVVQKFECPVADCDFITNVRKTFEDHRKKCTDGVVQSDEFPKTHRVWRGASNNVVLNTMLRLTRDQQMDILGCTDETYQQCLNDYVVFDDYIAFDFEATTIDLAPCDQPRGDRLAVVNAHYPCTYQIYSKTCGLTDKMIDECDNNHFELVRLFVEELLEHAAEIGERNKIKYSKLIDTQKEGSKTMNKLQDYIQNIPVCGFNSAKYDLNLVMSFGLIQELKEDCVDPISVIKQQNSYKCLKTEHLSFVDIYSFVSPEVSLDSFLKLNKAPQNKMKIDYSYSMKPENWNKSFPPAREECFNIRLD